MNNIIKTILTGTLIAIVSIEYAYLIGYFFTRGKIAAIKKN